MTKKKVIRVKQKKNLVKVDLNKKFDSNKKVDLNKKVNSKKELVNSDSKKKDKKIIPNQELLQENKISSSLKENKTKKVVKSKNTISQLKKDPRFVTTLKRINSFLNLASLKKIAIIADNDQDGVTAAVNLKLFFDSKKVESKVFFYDHYVNSFSLPIDYLISFNPEKTIFLDLSENFVSRILKIIGTRVGPSLLIDHHQSSMITNSPFRVVVVKPHSFSKIEPSKYPTSKIVFDLFGGKDWVSAIGVIGDFSFEQWDSFLDSVSKKYSLSRKKLIELDEIVGCVLAQYPEKINSLFEFLCKSKKPDKLFESDYVVFKNLFESRLKILTELFYKEAEYYSDVDLYFFKADNRFSGKLSNIISQHLPNQVVVIFEQSNEKIKCSIRRQDFKVNCGELAGVGVMGLSDCSGGGHIPAAGASFAIKDFDQFKKQVRLYLLNNPPKQKLSSHLN